MSRLNYFGVILVILSMNECLHKTKAYRHFDVGKHRIYFAFENETLLMECRKVLFDSYCVFENEADEGYFTTGNIEICTYKINATSNNVGQWKCYNGYHSGPGIERLITLEVKVVGEFAAVVSNVTSVKTKSAILHCAAARENMRLTSCRFQPPNDEAFSIDSNKSPVSNRYYFPTGKSLDNGDCAVNITGLMSYDEGKWTCSAQFVDGTEHSDVLYLNLKEPEIFTLSDRIYMIFTTFLLGNMVFTLTCQLQQKYAPPKYRHSERMFAIHSELFQTFIYLTKNLIKWILQQWRPRDTKIQKDKA